MTRRDPARLAPPAAGAEVRAESLCVPIEQAVKGGATALAEAASTAISEGRGDALARVGLPPREQSAPLRAFYL